MTYEPIKHLPEPSAWRGRNRHPVLAEAIEVAQADTEHWFEVDLRRRFPGKEITQNHRRSVRNSLRSAGALVRQIDNRVYLKWPKEADHDQ